MEFIGDLDGTVSLSLCWGRCRVERILNGGRKPKALLLRGALWRGRRLGGAGGTESAPPQTGRVRMRV